MAHGYNKVNTISIYEVALCPLVSVFYLHEVNTQIRFACERGKTFNLKGLVKQ